MTDETMKELNAMPEAQNDTEPVSEKGSQILVYGIQGVLVLAAILISLTIYHYTIVQKTVQKFALLDISEVVGLKQLAITELSLRKEVTDKDREGLYDQITAFSKDIEKAVADIQSECGCTLLVRSAVVKTTDGEDLTPVLKARLGLDKSVGELTDMIRKRSGAGSSAPQPSFDPKFDMTPNR